MKFAVRPALLRLAVIDAKLRSQSWPNASSLAKELEVTPRTIHRDIEYLRDQRSAPIAFDPEKNGFYYTEPSFQLPYFQVSEGECVALFLAERLLQQYRGTPFAGNITRLFEKVVDLLTEPITINLDHLNEAVSFRQLSSDLGEATRFAHLHRAICERRQLEIVYWTAYRNETGNRVIDPYHLAAIDGDWQLLAYCHRRKKVLTFLPIRIRALSETGETFERPADFCIDDYLDSGFRKVRGKGAARITENYIRKTARLEGNKLCCQIEKLRQKKEFIRKMAMSLSQGARARFGKGATNDD